MNEVPCIADIIVPFVDVRDVALAHLMAFKINNLKEKRIIVAQQSYSTIHIAHLLRLILFSKGYRVTTKVASYCMLKLISLCDEKARMALPFFNCEITADNTLSKELFGLDYSRDI